jgi:membrane protease YdiL (CAAX protease family)
MLLFLRTGHILGAILVHSFCNAMGLPSIRHLFTKDGHLHRGKLPFI